MKFILNMFTLTRGQDEQILVALLDDNGFPINISGATAIKLQVKKADGTLLEKEPTTGMTIGVCCACWFYAFSFSAEETLLLNKSTNQTIQLKVTLGEMIHYIALQKCLTVVDPAIVL